MSSDYYAILGVECSASRKDISKAFRAKARLLHPDKQPPDASDEDRLKAKQAFQALVVAYETLSDRSKRYQYDLSHSPADLHVTPERRDAQERGCNDEFASSAESADNFYRPAAAGGTAKWNAEEEDRQRLNQDLHSEWTKPAQVWEGWARSGTGQGGPQDFKLPEKEVASDDELSEASSILSFACNVNLDELDLSDLEPVEFVEANTDAMKSGRHTRGMEMEEMVAKLARLEAATAPATGASSTEEVVKAPSGKKSPQSQKCCSVQ
eukprot:gnl/TRDRNA2_/TRDRNA2_94276_c0_seq1.p1 gnl/TRDRNA2_/TRDRNA2_94276_c0~~gnl/TRDRNA2_/TRDRNA2_94276_c0_seq1.p1  ORF type:complete len:267 (-),score=53.75 gnl/TRDRNA2_/TRDRNA2_94276_c0_seq1:6-806(-)